ncbi:hypothetical protein [Paracoccus homiensis]|uniref:Transglycosylase SLT domain-containing protein n=1 Tax=Paracoccus homiensis TaxID=364199 RepID=A0A1I0GUF9_9RHOB|nr:hypothetical protein [Paracoccus homiensis]SET74986.1 hypothetical protein SAMN04489858_10995 [Paracoccus homiensis]
MAMRVPGYERREVVQVQQPVGVTPRQSGVGQVAQGLANAGAMFDQWQADVDEADAKRADTAFSQDIRTALNDPEKGYLYARGGDAMSRRKEVISGLEQAYNQRLNGLSPAAKEMAQRALQARKDSALSGIATHAGRERITYLDNQSDARMQAAVNDALVDPRSIDRSRQILRGEISERASRAGWSPEQTAAAYTTAESEMYRMATVSMAQSDPVAAAEFLTAHAATMDPGELMAARDALLKPLAAVAERDAISGMQAGDGPAVSLDDIVAKIIGAESSGNPNAKNPNSSASGLGQFIDSTWLNVVKKYRPDVAAGRSDADLIALKGDRALGREMTLRYTQENASALQAAGHVATPGNVYLAHFLGPAGARTVLAASDDASVSDLLPAEVLKANSFLRGMTVADLRGWSDKKMGGTGVVQSFSPRVSEAINALPSFQAEQVRQASFSGVSAWQTQEAAAVKAAQTQAVDSFKLRIAQADKTLTDGEILSADIDDGDKATLITSRKTKFKEVAQTATDVAAFQAGRLIVDPYSGEGRKRADALFGEMAKTIPEGQSSLPMIEGIVEQTGIVPSSVSGALRMGLTSRDPAQVQQALMMGQRIDAIDPHAMGRRDGGGQVSDRVDLFNHLTGPIGLSAEDATRRIMDMDDPQKQADRKALLGSPDTETWLKENATTESARAVFDEGWFSSAPQLGETPMQSAAATAEYREILQESLVDANGDEDMAKQLAASRFRRRYGVSSYNLSQSGAVTRLPPEVTYPKGLDGTHDYIGEQAIAALSAEDITASSVFMQADVQTEADMRAGRPPRYALFYVDEEGMVQQFQHAFYADPPSPADIAKTRRDEAMKAQRDLLRRNQELRAPENQRGNNALR